MAMASTADLNTAVGTVMTEVNRHAQETSNLQRRLDTMERNFNTGGQELLERTEAKKLELTTLFGVMQQDMAELN